MKNKKKRKLFEINSKRAQLTIFIIFSILIIIVLVLIFINRPDIIPFFNQEIPIDQIKKCINEAATEGIDLLSVQGGSIEPKNYYFYYGNKVEYTCYTDEYYKKCVMQKPLLKQSIQEELKIYLEPKILNCVESVASSFETKGYTVSYKNPLVKIEIIPKNVVVNTELDLKISKENTNSYNDIKVNIYSNLYEFIMTSSSISNWEARYGDSETLNYMIYYPSMKVEKKTRSDGTRVYILTDRDSLQKFMFATRSVAFPSGILGM